MIARSLHFIKTNALEDRFRLLEGGDTIGEHREFIRGIDMSNVTVELELPQDWKRFQMPVALKARLNSLLDESDKSGELNKAEREEAQALSVQAHPVPVVQADGLNCSAIRRPTLVSVPATAAIGRALSETTDYSPAPRRHSAAIGK